MTTAAPPEDLTADVLYAADDDEDMPTEDELGLAPEDAEDLTAPDENAPYGYTVDPKTKERRPKKTAGRPKAPRTADELAAAPPVEPAEDKPPQPRPGRVKAAISRAVGAPGGAPPPPPPPPPDDADVPMPKGGVIAKEVDRLYRRGGKIARAFWYDMGQAMIECTRPDPEDPDAPTVGQAWEDIAKTNVRIRAWLLKIIAGGQWQALIWAHAPMGIALVSSSVVQRLIPRGAATRLMESMLEPDEDSEENDLLPEDGADMMALAEQQAQRIAAKMGARVPPGVAQAAMRQAQQAAARQGILTPPYAQHDLPPDEAAAAAPNGSGPAPAGARRQQPKNSSRAQRRR